jgi:hypothetical protein
MFLTGPATPLNDHGLQALFFRSQETRSLRMIAYYDSDLGIGNSAVAHSLSQRQHV